MDDTPDYFRTQHAGLVTTQLADKTGKKTRKVHFNEAESPLLWMHRRKGPDGQPLISNIAFAAGERLRRDYTLGNMTPRLTADWSNPIAGTRQSSNHNMNATEGMIAASQRFDRAMSDCGPEFSGLLLDLCCFLKGLEQIEQERKWPARSAKLVARLALQRLARHYGISEDARGRSSGKISSWGAPGYRPDLPGRTG